MDLSLMPDEATEVATLITDPRFEHLKPYFRGLTLWELYRVRHYEDDIVGMAPGSDRLWMKVFLVDYLQAYFALLDQMARKYDCDLSSQGRNPPGLMQRFRAAMPSSKQEPELLRTCQ